MANFIHNGHLCVDVRRSRGEDVLIGHTTARVPMTATYATRHGGDVYWFDSAEAAHEWAEKNTAPVRGGSPTTFVETRRADGSRGSVNR